MLKALVIKELRESAGIVTVAGFGALYVLAMATGMRLVPYGTGPSNFPFVADMFLSCYVLVIGALAVAMGLKQSAWETGQGTYHFLLHRPASRTLIFGAKLATGAGMVLAIGGLLILMYALWAATPGNNLTPFYWSMTVAAWRLWGCMSLVYLGAFLSGVRPARWFGTRLVPLVAASMCVFLISLASWWWLWVSALAVCAALILASIFYYVRQRDY
jgi:hypothetical protein